MKKVFLICALLVVVIQSCKKESEEGLRNININVSLAQGAAYHFDLKKYIKAKEFPVITRSPLNYRVSRILYNGNVSGPVYEFITDAPVGSTDKAIVKVVKEHEHNPLEAEHDEMNHIENDDYTSVIVTISFTIQ
jgi:hypothetical protein